MSSTPAISPTAAVTGRARPGIAGGRAARFIVPAAGLAALALFAALYLWRREAYFDALSFIGIAPYKIPFFDLEYILAGPDCWRRGIDVYVGNPCDLENRAWTYSPLLLRAWFLPGTAWTNPLGLLLAVSFFGALAAFPLLRERKALLLLLAAALSPRVVYAIERGNIDVLIFIAMVAAAVLAVGGTARRLSGYGLIALAGLAKIYPFIALGLSLRERRWRFIGIAAAGLAIIAGFALSFRAELAAMAVNVPSEHTRDAIGAANLPAALGPLLPIPYAALLIWAGLLARSGAQMVRLARWREFRAAFAALPPLEANLLVLGTLLIVGCFFTGISFGYRGIYLLLALPALAAMMADGGTAGAFARSTSLFIVVLMWEGFVTWVGAVPKFVATLAPPVGPKLLDIVWLLRELVWWHITAVMAGMLVCFALESDAAKALLSPGKPARP
jgi:hypothetical protein